MSAADTAQIVIAWALVVIEGAVLLRWYWGKR